MIYFDNAATSYPKPERVARSVNGYFRLYGANPGRGGYRMSMDTAEMVYSCREAVRALFGARAPENTVFTQNCTHALNLAIKGVMSAGGHMIISDLEHNSVSRPAQALSDKGIASYSVAATYADDEKTVRSFESLIRPDTKLIACTHASNVFGFVLPVEGIARMARDHGVLMLVDAAQTAGVLDINVQRAGMDFLCAAGHKGLMGPTGTGVLVTHLGEQLDTVFEGGTGSSSILLTQPDYMPERLETGTVNTMGIAALKAGVDYVRLTGPANIYRHEMDIIIYLYDNLKRIKGVKLYTQRPVIGRSVPVLSFNLEGKSAEDTVAELASMDIAVRGGLHCAPLAHKKMGTIEGGTVRVSPGHFNTIQEARRFCAAIQKILGF